MSLKRTIRKFLYSHEFFYTLYKRDGYKYHTDLFEKKKYKHLLTNDCFKYDGGLFYYYINNDFKFVYSKRLIDNISINYNLLINNPLNDLLVNIDDKDYLKFIKEYFNKIRIEVEKSQNDNKNNIIKTIDNIFTSKSNDLFDALQRILFINELLWQTGHRLNVLGRLDYILNDIYKNSGISYDDAKKLVYEFLRILDKDYYYKSNALKGDTGQVVILGGLDENDKYFSCDLTHIFIECIKELQLPDPKTLLRVSKEMPSKLLDEALDSIKTGCGSPLLSNDDVVIPSLMDIGYTKADACNYATSACWEPLCDGASLEQNNFADLNFIRVLNDTLNLNYDSFDNLLDNYKKNIRNEIDRIANDLNNVKFAYDPLMSTFLLDCSKNKKDVSLGGARYNNFGVLTTGLGNSIDSLINIKSLVFDQKKYELSYLVNEMKNNFNNEELLNELKNNTIKYGKDDEAVISLSNNIIEICNDEFSKFKTSFNGEFRFGLSSPNYILNSYKTNASLDGRRDFEPFIVHISSNAEVSYSELVNFASKLSYGNRNVNGNVIDLMISPSFIDNNFKKFTKFLEISIKSGIFQMQFNVIDSETLIKAKANPEKYKNLIVRVWGFSAYFVELPVEYQDLLIRRAKLSESAC